MTQLEALALTWLLELPFALLATRRVQVRFVVVVVVASLVTHPFVWAIGSHVPVAWWWPVMLVVEAAVGVIEGLLLWKAGGLSRREGLLVGVGMNAFSFGVGLLL